MQISDLISNPRLTVENVRSDALAKLRPGQIVQARVLNASSAGSLRLRIGNVEIAARTPLQFNAGERLTLSVVRTAAPIELKLLHQANPREVQARVLRSALPRQMPLGRLMEQLGKLGGAGHTSPRGIPGTATPTAENSPTADRPLTTPRAGREVPVAKTLDTAGRPIPAPPARSPATAAPPVAAAAAQTPLAKGSLTPASMEAVQRVLGHFPLAEQPPTPERLRRAFKQSGIFLETNLAQGVNPGRDLKADLLRLLMQITLDGGKTGHQQAQAPGQKDAVQQQSLQSPVSGLLGELRNQAEAGLARILVNQLGALPQADGTQQVWSFDLPVRQAHDSDNFTLQISREHTGNRAEADAVWSVHLQFDLAGLGPVSSRITLSGDEISSHFAAESEDTVERLALAMPQLNQALARAGLKVGSLSTGRGRIDSAQAAAERIPPLLDEKA